MLNVLSATLFRFVFFKDDAAFENKQLREDANVIKTESCNLELPRQTKSHWLKTTKWVKPKIHPL